MPTADQFAAAAQALEGVRWRKHGRNPTRGLDCAGVPVAAAREVGLSVVDSIDYDAAMPRPEMLWQFCSDNAEACGLSEAGEGRVGLCRWDSGGAVRHLVVMLSGRRIVHVDASVRRVTVVPAGWLDGRLAAVFRVHGIEYGAPWPR